MNKSIARQIWFKEFKDEPNEVYRFWTGHCNYVFRVTWKQKKYVLRISHPDNKAVLEGSLYWLSKLSKLDLNIPVVIRSNPSHNPPYMVLSYIEGKDLGAVYNSLTEKEKQDIVEEVVYSQNQLLKIPHAKGYGYLKSYNDMDMRSSWKDVIVKHIQRSEKRIIENNIFKHEYIKKLYSLLPQFSDYFSTIESVPFFDDTTTKNVLVNNGRFEGIVDLDCVCFGDRLYVIALTRMALIDSQFSLSYIDYWINKENLSAFQCHVLDLYTLIFCVDFMSEQGMKFNKASVPFTSKQRINQLSEIYEKLINKI